MQAESGQALGSIVARKELERRTCGGLFFWGVGNAPGSEPARLARAGALVEAIFSVMKSRPKSRDAEATELNVWGGYVDHFGVQQALPAGVLVTSRAADLGMRPRAHYALMCRSEQPIALADYGPFDPGAFRNVSGRGAPVGASQVTALLRPADARFEPVAGYRTNLKAQLTGAYWVRLVAPTRLKRGAAARLLARLEEVAGLGEADWLDLVNSARSGPGAHVRRERDTVDGPALAGRGFAPIETVA
jgi:hypothetical protein